MAELYPDTPEVSRYFDTHRTSLFNNALKVATLQI